MKNLDPRVQLEILGKQYITRKDIYELLPIGKNSADDIFQEIEKELIEKGIPLFNVRPAVIPLDYLLKRYPIDERRLEKAVKRKMAILN